MTSKKLICLRRYSRAFSLILVFGRCTLHLCFTYYLRTCDLTLLGKIRQNQHCSPFQYQKFDILYQFLNCFNLFQKCKFSNIAISILKILVSVRHFVRPSLSSEIRNIEAWKSDKLDPGSGINGIGNNIL